MLLKILLISCTFLSFLLILEQLKIKKLIDTEYTRKFLHIFGCFFSLIIFHSTDQKIFLLLCFVCSVFLLISYKTKRFTSIHDITRKSWGSFLLPLGIAVTSISSYLGNDFFTAGVLQLSLADGGVGLFQYYTEIQKNDFRRHLLFFTTSTLCYLIIFPLPLALLSALAQTVVERISPIGTDNLTLPVTYLILILILK